LEGVIRIAIFIGYVAGISLMKDIKRVYMYHGAEHKCINCIEHGLPLTVENVRKSSKEHKRCGTSFLLIVVVISTLVFMFVKTDTLWLRMVSRILLLPVITGISYEFLRLAGRSESGLVDLLSRPGLLLQGLNRGKALMTGAFHHGRVVGRLKYTQNPANSDLIGEDIVLMQEKLRMAEDAGQYFCLLPLHAVLTDGFKHCIHPLPQRFFPVAAAPFRLFILFFQAIL